VILEEEPSGPRTNLGASNFRDSTREPSGLRTNLGASRFVTLEGTKRAEDKAWSESIS
jgi:hypothetical protein